MRTFLPSPGALLPVPLPRFRFRSRPAPLGATEVSAEMGAAAVVAPGHQSRRALRGVISDPVINIYYICWFSLGIGHAPRG